MKNQTDIERAFWGTLRTSGAAKPPFPNCWPSMKAPEQDALLEDLEDWVRWAVDRYELDYRTIPPCWACHGPLVEELSALHSAWLTVFQPSSRGTKEPSKAAYAARSSRSHDGHGSVGAECFKKARRPSSSSTVQCSFTDQPPLVTRVHAVAAEPRICSAALTASGFTARRRSAA